MTSQTVKSLPSRLDGTDERFRRRLLRRQEVLVLSMNGGACYYGPGGDQGKYKWNPPLKSTLETVHAPQNPIISFVASSRVRAFTDRDDVIMIILHR